MLTLFVLTSSLEELLFSQMMNDLNIDLQYMENNVASLGDEGKKSTCYWKQCNENKAVICFMKLHLKQHSSYKYPAQVMYPYLDKVKSLTVTIGV